MYLRKFFDDQSLGTCGMKELYIYAWYSLTLEIIGTYSALAFDFCPLNLPLNIHVYYLHLHQYIIKTDLHVIYTCVKHVNALYRNKKDILFRLKLRKYLYMFFYATCKNFLHSDKLSIRFIITYKVAVNV